MENSKELVNRFREVFIDGKWIANTNYQLVLKDVDLAMANTQVSDLNTIGILSFHVNYYLKGVLKVFQGGDLEIRDKFSFDAPPLVTEVDWENLKKEIVHHAEMLAAQIEQLNEEQLNAVFVLEQYGTYRRNVEGLIEHAYYHLGQISLIKKLLQSRS